MIQRDHKINNDDCYFCSPDGKCYKSKIKKNYFHQPIPHSAEIPVPVSPDYLPDSDLNTEEQNKGQTFQRKETDKSSQLLIQSELFSDRVSITQKICESLGFTLKEKVIYSWNINVFDIEKGKSFYFYEKLTQCTAVILSDQ